MRQPQWRDEIHVEIDWANWIKTVQAQPNDILSLLETKFNFKMLDDPGHARALIQAVKHRNHNLLFLENEENDHRFIAFEDGNDWYIRILPREIDEDSLAILIRYTIKLSNLFRDRRERKGIGDYYSLRPLIYGGDFWLEEICADEIDRFQDLDETRNFSVLLMNWDPGDSLFELVESLRRGDRIGYFGEKIGVALPFTSRTQATEICERLQQEYFVEEISRWSWKEQFKNYFELKTEIEKIL